MKTFNVVLQSVSYMPMISCWLAEMILKKISLKKEGKTKLLNRCSQANFITVIKQSITVIMSQRGQKIHTNWRDVRCGGWRERCQCVSCFGERVLCTSDGATSSKKRKLLETYWSQGQPPPQPCPGELEPILNSHATSRRTPSTPTQTYSSDGVITRVDFCSPKSPASTCSFAQQGHCQRVFSATENIVTPHRSSLKPHKVNMLVFLACNKEITQV